MQDNPELKDTCFQIEQTTKCPVKEWGGEGQHEDTSLKFPKQNTSDKWKILKASKRKKKKTGHTRD